jgi:hypothetical protein
MAAPTSSPWYAYVSSKSLQPATPTIPHTLPIPVHAPVFIPQRNVAITVDTILINSDDQNSKHNIIVCKESGFIVDLENRRTVQTPNTPSTTSGVQLDSVKAVLGEINKSESSVLQKKGKKTRESQTES